MTWLTLTPIISAASRSNETARTAFPVRDRLTQRVSTTITTAVPTITNTRTSHTRIGPIGMPVEMSMSFGAS